MKLLNSTFAFLLMYFFTTGQTQLSPGDIALLTLNSDGLKSFDAVLLHDIDSGTAINFTDNAYVEGVGLQSNEGIITFISDTSMPAGTIISYISETNKLFTKSGSFLPSTAGDNLLIFQTSNTSDTTYLYGAGWAETVEGNWTFNEAKHTKTSDIPPQLSIENSTITYLGNKDNYQFDTTLYIEIGTDTILEQLANPLNYIPNDDSDFTNIAIPFIVPKSPDITLNNICESTILNFDTLPNNYTVYSDSLLKNIVSQISFQNANSAELYFTHTVNNIESKAQKVSFNIIELPEVPEYTIADNTITLTNALNYTTEWYIGETKQENSSSYFHFTNTDDVISVVYSNNNCFSEKATINVEQLTTISKIQTEERSKYELFDVYGRKINSNIDQLVNGVYMIYFPNTGSSKVMYINNSVR